MPATEKITKKGTGFLTVFPRLVPQLLFKDVGGLPRHLALSCGWHSSLAYFESCDNPLEGELVRQYKLSVNLVSLGKVGGRLANQLRMAVFFAEESRRFDVVNLYHDSVKNMLYALVYKLFNRRGTVWFKLDMSHLEMERIERQSKSWIHAPLGMFKFLLSRAVVDVYTVETRQFFDRLSTLAYFRGRLWHLPNGVDIPSAGAGAYKKENIILTVGNLGSAPKNTELLIDAVAHLDPAVVEGWQVLLVGPVVNADYYESGFREDDRFHSYVEGVVREKPHLRDVFVFTGRIDERRRLEDIYRRASIFCLTSNYESFGFVVPEAMSFGDYVIASDLPPIRELTDNGRLGALFPPGDCRCLAELLSSAMTGRVDLERHGRDAAAFIRDNYSWDTVAVTVDRILRSRMVVAWQS